MPSDKRFVDPPPGFVVLRETELDPEQGRPDLWVCRGIVNGRSIIRSGLRSRPSACRAAWFVYDDECAIGRRPVAVDIAEFDSAVAEALARRHAIQREREVERATMRAEYRVALDSWHHMIASLLSQIIEDAKSMRRAARIVDVPKSTLSAWVRLHKERGSWPR